MKTKLMIMCVLFFSLFFGKTEVMGQVDANELLHKMDLAMFAVKDKTATIKMIMTNVSSMKQKEKEAVIMQKGASKKLFRYVYPKSDSGIATLSLPNDEIYLYLPLFKKPRKITNLAEGDAFNQSDFSIEDMATKPYTDKYTASLISTNDTAYVLNLKPKTSNSSYSHVTLYLNKTYFYPEKFKFYNKYGKAWKESMYQFTKIEKYWIPKTVTMVDLIKGHSTTIIMSNIKINQGLSDDLFTLKNLTGTPQITHA